MPSKGGADKSKRGEKKGLSKLWHISKKDAAKGTERDVHITEEEQEDEPKRERRGWSNGYSLLDAFLDRTKDAEEPHLQQLSEKLQDAKTNQDALDALWELYCVASENSRQPKGANANTAVPDGVPELPTQPAHKPLDLGLENSLGGEGVQQGHEAMESRVIELQSQLEAVERAKRQVEEEKEESDAKYLSMTASLSRVNTENFNLRNRLNPLEKASGNIAQATERLEMEKRGLEVRLHQLQTDNAAAFRDRDGWESYTMKMENEKISLEKAVEKLENDLANSNLVRDNHLKRFSAIGDENEKSKKRLTLSFERQREAITKKHELDLEAIKKDHGDEIERERLRLKDHYEAEVAVIREVHDKRLQSLRTKIGTLQQDLTDQHDDLTAQHKAELAKGKMAYDLVCKTLNEKDEEIRQAKSAEARRQQDIYAVKEKEWIDKHDQVEQSLSEEQARHSEKEKQLNDELEALQEAKELALTEAKSNYEVQLGEERSRHEGEVARVEARARKIKADAERHMTVAMEDHKAKVKKMEDDLEEAKDELRQEMHKEAIYNDARIKQLEQQYQSQNSKLRLDHQTKMSRAEAAWKISEQELNMAIQRWQQACEDEKRASKAKLKELKDRLQAQEDDLVRKFGQEKATLQKAQDDERVSNARELRNQQHNHSSEIDSLKKDHQARIKKLEDDIVHANRNLTIKYEAQIQEMKADRATKEALLRKEIDAKDDFFMEREKFTPITDRELKERFANILDDVDYLARRDWEFNNTLWTDDTLGSLAKQPQQKRLKKEILQDTIWLILYEHLFCSPFRILGEKGKELEEDWIEEFGEDSKLENRFYTWPEPDVKAETWRYNTMKYCQEALYEPSSKLSKETAIKNEFRTSFQYIVEQLLELLGQVSEVDAETTATVRGLVKKATAAWIKMGTQWCRVMIVLPQSSMRVHGERLEKMKQEEGLELVSVAALKRFGNSRGQDMEKCDTITESVIYQVSGKKS